MLTVFRLLNQYNNIAHFLLCVLFSLTGACSILLTRMVAARSVDSKEMKNVLMAMGYVSTIQLVNSLFPELYQEKIVS